jgi:hypothetical protein
VHYCVKLGFGIQIAIAGCDLNSVQQSLFAQEGDGCRFGGWG